VETAVNSSSLSSGFEALKDDRKFSGVAGDHTGAPGGSVAVSTEAGLDLDVTIFNMVRPGSGCLHHIPIVSGVNLLMFVFSRILAN